MTRFIKYCRSWVELVFKTRSLALASRLVSAEIWHFYVQRDPRGLWLTPLDMSLATARQWPWLLPCLSGAILLKNQAGAVFGEYRGQFRMEIRGLSLLATTGEELFTADEVFVQNVYRFIPRQTVVVMDIGMNVGYASLLFASMPQVAAVFSFEPFPQTYEQAVLNIGLNPACAAKIRMENTGLADTNREVTAAYDASAKGGSSVYVPPNPNVPASACLRLRDAVEALDSVMSSYPDLPIVVKMDCEGAEYEILEAWAAGLRLGGLSLIMIEWHRFVEGHNPARLCKLLADAGFDIFAREDFSVNTGMIYAAHTTSRSA